MLNIILARNDFDVALDLLINDFPYAIWETLYATIISTFFAVIIGLPLGILLVVGEKNNILPLPKPVLTFLNWLINIFRSIPFIILMVLVLPLSKIIVGTKLGTIATIVPLVIAAAPFIARLIESSIREINPNTIEAALSMGASPFQIIIHVLIPESMPSIVGNITIAFTTILGYTAMSGAVGGGGLGRIAISYGYQRFNTPVMILAVVFIVLLVIIFQSLGTYISKKMDRRIRNKA